MSMPRDLLSWLPADGVEVIVVLVLSLLVGVEREERKSEHYIFGGVRTFPLIGLIGWAVARVAGGQPLIIAIGFAVVGAFLLASYRHKITGAEAAGATSEMSGLMTYLVGALVQVDYYWIATMLVVVSVFLLELKGWLESAAAKAEPVEILTFTKLLVLTAIILPVLPNRPFGPFEINPFRTWLVVVAVSGLSYGSYLLQRISRPQGGIVLVGVLGGIYSSTVTTVVLARRSKAENRPRLFAGSILVACGMMYLRIAVLLALFNHTLAAMLWRPFVALAAGAVLAGVLWTRLPDASSERVERRYEPRNPLELRAALLFAVLFVTMLVVTRLAASSLGAAGVYALAAVMGVADVDPFILGMTATAGQATPWGVAAVGILIAASSNNLVKGFYAYAFADRRAGLQGLVALVGLALAGLSPMFWF
jgi:uncharacterized membrane protein (DUF4010 family)